MIVNIRVLSKRKMSFYNSVHYCQGNAGILDLYSTLSVRLCVCLCFCVYACVYVWWCLISTLHYRFCFFLALAKKPHVAFELFIHSLIRPSIHPSLC